MDRDGEDGGNARVPGRRMRSQIGIEVSDDAECAARIKRLERRLGKLESRKVAALLMKDALNGDMTCMRLLLRIVGVLDDADEKVDPKRFAGVGKPRRKDKNGELAS